MACYIDADLFLEDQIKRCGCIPLIGSCTMDNKPLNNILDNQPTADAVEVKHGEWNLHPDGSGTCNLCGRTQKSVWDFDNVQTYCGKCGAKMDGGNKDDFIEKWIDVNDRLPTDNDMLISSVLIYTEDGGVAEAGYDIKNNRFLQYRWSNPNPEVLYWMPLPKPPKGASNETD